MRIEGDRDQLMREGDAAWTELCAVLDATDPDTPLHAPDSPEWTSRDVYTHFWRMHSSSMHAIRSELGTGDHFEWPGIDEDELNERHAAIDRVISFEDARRVAIESRQQYRALVASLTDAQFDDIGRCHGDDLLGGHYRGHLSYIRAASQD